MPDPSPLLRWLPRSGRALAAGFIALGLFLLASVLFSFQQQGDDALLRHALEVEVDLGDLRSALLGAEVGQRSYLLTGKSEFLAPYRDASAQLDRLLDRLARAVHGDAGQDALFTELQDAVARRRSELAATLALQDGGDQAGALRAVGSQAGLELMNDIHAFVLRMDDAQDRLVIARQDAMRGIKLATSVTTAVSLVLMGLVALAALAEVRKRARLARFLPAEVATRLADGESGLLQGRSGPATVAFVDVRGFTALAERLTPEALSTSLAAFRGTVSDAARSCGGMVDKFIGDGALVVFGALDGDQASAGNALRFAEALRAALPPLLGGAAFRVGVGIHHGEVFCGIVGGAERQEFTVLGDMVNVASRIEEATKAFGADLLVSEAVLRAAGADRGAWRDVSRAPLRGRSESIALYAPQLSREVAAVGGVTTPSCAPASPGLEQLRR
ncbi:adenylate/guanylate cyclase domain-containing protein [Lichenibacterium dinghuense]|uniref:adenylate/guanylate cyclase domain-containing protein n=1 Tax=Lichenibacterium dinghuense TaxID=2895977 RepID=UPI001F25A045|nr:CHASE3 domain-containing protein [Lichenibacterium sp. 6Y81]